MDDALTLLSRLLQRFREWLGRQAEHDLEIGDIKGALRLAELEVRLFPKVAESWEAYARTLRNLEDEQRVQQVLERAVEKTRGAASTQADLIKSLLMQRKLDEAKRIIAALSESTSDRGYLELSLARLAFVEEKWSDVIPHIELMSNSAGVNSWGLIDASSILMIMGVEEDRAIQFLTSALDMEENWGARIMLAALLEDRNPEEASRQLVKARQVSLVSQDKFDNEVNWARGSVKKRGRT